ncbi:uncharacterized protein [Parasteatoda tepidariorum]|uniref:uncharacterized protein n=1 Tax=Parasteatoda tepidariorum TaxID=114398 RepID=UPI0039BC4509
MALGPDLMLLLQSSKARSIVESYPPFKSNYIKVIKHLKSRFGRHDLLRRRNLLSAFQITGVDLAGPLQLRQGIKAWIVLFTCAVHRAIHLELVTSLSSEAFMQAMRRFFARRERCSVIYSDNGTYFTGTARALQSLNWEELQSQFALQNIKWHFSPPTAPWYGGREWSVVSKKFYESAWEMLTLLCEAESVITGRPLTYLSDDPNEMTPITPANFIQDIRVSETHDIDIVNSKHLLKRVRYLQSLRENLRKRFKEYLGELVRNPKSRSKQKEISVGEIVLIGCEGTKGLNCFLARTQYEE